MAGAASRLMRTCFLMRLFVISRATGNRSRSHIPDCDLTRMRRAGSENSGRAGGYRFLPACRVVEKADAFEFPKRLAYWLLDTQRRPRLLGRGVLMCCIRLRHGPAADR